MLHVMSLLRLQICNVLRADGLLYQDVEDLLAVGYSMNPNIKLLLTLLH